MIVSWRRRSEVFDSFVSHFPPPYLDDGVVLDVANSRPISRSLSFLKDIVKEQEGDELINIAQNIAQEHRYTAYYNPNGGTCKPAKSSSTSIDHVLISPSLQTEHSITKFDTGLFPPPCAQQRPYSDHWPLVIDFDVNARTAK